MAGAALLSRNAKASMTDFAYKETIRLGLKFSRVKVETKIFSTSLIVARSKFAVSADRRACHVMKLLLQPLS